MTTRSILEGYNFVKFQGDLVKLRQSHPHVVRRESAMTYRDEYALREIIDMYPNLYDQFLKGWSRSYYLPDRHLEQILQYGSPNIPISAIDVTLYKQSIEEAKNRLRSLQRARAYDVLSELDKVSFKPSSAAGYDYVGEKGPYGGQNHKRAISRAKAVLWSAIAPDGEGIDHVIDTMVPDVSYTRTQLTDLTEKTKVRAVWGRAFHYILLEGVVADPLLKSIISNDSFIHAGKDPTHSVPMLLNTINERCKWIYALDWKQFDATVSRFEINSAFDIIRSFVDFPNVETLGAFEISRQLFIHKKIAAPDGFIYWSHKGIPSGSYFTTMIGSIVNFLRIDYLWRLLVNHPPLEIYTLGDDSLIGDNILLLPDNIAKEANKIGWHFNPSKTEYSKIPEYVTFLGRTSQGGLNIRDLKRCLRLLVYPEYPVTSGRISAYRAQSIAEDAGNMSDLLNRLALRLKRQYGIASEDEVPQYFKRYIFSI